MLRQPRKPPSRTSSQNLEFFQGKYRRWSSAVVKSLWFTLILRVCHIAWVPWVVWVCGFTSWVVWVKLWHSSCGSHGSTKFWCGSKKWQGSKFWCWWNIRLYELLLWFYKVLLVILVSSLFSLHMQYCKELSTQFTVFYISLYSIISMKRHYSKNEKIKSISKILLNYSFQILLNYLFSNKK